MAGFKFVGFQEHVEIPEGFSQILLQEEIQSSLSKEATFSMLSEPQLISSWFVNVSSLQSKQGGKFSFTSDKGSGEGVCLAAVMGREIALLADEFGEFRAKVNQSGDDVNVSVTFKILTDAPDAKRVQLESYISNLKAVLK
jgi:hypothetical protein